MLSFKILLIPFMLLTSIVCRAGYEGNDSLKKARIGGLYFKSYLLDTRDLLFSPGKWKTRDWIYAGSAVGGIVYLVSERDLKIQKYVQERTTETSGLITKHGLEPWGSGVYSMSVMGLFYAHGLIFKNERSKKVALLGVKAYLVSGLLVNIPKYLFRRYRPYQSDTPDPYNWFGSLTGKHTSFISGHTTSIFSVATIVASEYKKTVWVPVVAYSIATLAGLSRIHDNKHWASDVLGGALFGYAVGKLIYNRNNWKLSIFPYKGKDETGMLITIPVK